MKNLFFISALLLLFCNNLIAQSGKIGVSNLSWNISSNTLTISGNEKMPDFSKTSDIPWYNYRSNIENVIIKPNVTSIGERAFQGCNKLKNIDIPNSVTSIGQSAFLNCSALNSVDIPNSVTAIGPAAFFKCFGLNNINIPNNMSSLQDYIFYGCSGLTEIIIPANISSIGIQAFYSCTSLKSFTSLAAVPPTVLTNAFSAVDLSLVTLFVPANSLQRYGSKTEWKEFSRILPVK